MALIIQTAWFISLYIKVLLPVYEHILTPIALDLRELFGEFEGIGGETLGVLKELFEDCTGDAVDTAGEGVGTAVGVEEELGVEEVSGVVDEG
jgi:hypothetical protein